MFHTNVAKNVVLSKLHKLHGKKLPHPMKLMNAISLPYSSNITQMSQRCLICSKGLYIYKKIGQALPNPSDSRSGALSVGPGVVNH